MNEIEKLKDIIGLKEAILKQTRETMEIMDKTEAKNRETIEMLQRIVATNKSTIPKIAIFVAMFFSLIAIAISTYVILSK